MGPSDAGITEPGDYSDRSASEQIDRARRRIRKFIDRSAPGLGAPVIALRDQERGQLAGTLRWQQVGENWQVTSLDWPSLDKRLLDSVIVECRPFFMASEDSFLPGIVKALQLLSPNRARALDPLKAHVAQIVRSGGLVSPEGQAGIYSGRLEMDNGLGPGRLLGSDQIAMDYINGITFHEDDVRRARLENVSGMETVLFAVLYQMDSLLRVVDNVRRQVLHDVEAGHIDLSVPEGT